MTSHIPRSLHVLKGGVLGHAVGRRLDAAGWRFDAEAAIVEGREAPAVRPVVTLFWDKAAQREAEEARGGGLQKGVATQIKVGRAVIAAQAMVWSGTGIPRARPRRETRPDRLSASIRRPRARS